MTKLTILLDAAVGHLKPGLKGAGFKIILASNELNDDQFKELAEGTALISPNANEFLNDAVLCDYDVISIDAIGWIDTEPDKVQQCVFRIATAIRTSGFYRMRGNFHLKILPDGAWTVDRLI